MSHFRPLSSSVDAAMDIKGEQERLDQIAAEEDLFRWQEEQGRREKNQQLKSDGGSYVFLLIGSIVCAILIWLV